FQVPPADEARRLRYLLEFQTDEFVGMEVKSITDEVLTRESAARVTIDAGGKKEELAFRATQAEIANSADRARREALEQASLAVIEDLTPVLSERLGIERGIARTFGHETYDGLWSATSGIDLRALDELMQGFLARTEDMYREAMGWVVRKRLAIPLEDAKRHDLHWIFRGQEFDDHFSKSGMTLTAKRVCEEMGVDIAAGGNIRFDLEPRERKTARAFCAPLEVPRRVVLVLAPEGGRRDWQQFLHELGRALHSGYTSPEEPYEFRRLGDASLSETYAFLFQYLLLDGAWLKRNVGMQKPKSFLFLANLEKLTYLRRYAAKLRYELELFRGESGVEGKDALYEESMAKALRVRYPKELFLYDVDRSFYVARYLRAWLFEALLSKHLVHYFDEDWYRNPRTGAFLKRHWAMGRRYGVEEMAKEIGYAGLDTAPLEEEILKAL
ncbi:MAG TPA: hypothetical protein VHF22_12390, partial [Planctomycetota bacterium]|nr:hypothetical protein [Planctomycetota bacterium]